MCPVEGTVEIVSVDRYRVPDLVLDERGLVQQDSGYGGSEKTSIGEQAVAHVGC